jgi:hypothetical protein
MLVPRQVLLNAIAVVHAIEETLAAADEEDFPENKTPPTLTDIDLPDSIADPFELARFLHGDDYARRLEYEGDLAYIAELMDGWVREELRRRGLRSAAEFFDSGDEEAQEDA